MYKSKKAMLSIYMVVYTAVLSCKYLNTSVQMQCLFVALSVSADRHVHVHRRTRVRYVSYMEYIL